jgi:hypothetical protein
VAEKTKGLVRRFPMGAANAVRELKGETSKDLVPVMTGGRHSRPISGHL